MVIRGERQLYSNGNERKNDIRMGPWLIWPGGMGVALCDAMRCDAMDRVGRGEEEEESGDVRVAGRAGR